eukprot:1161491-Pelagomonas_calceolata.AAC.4
MPGEVFWSDPIWEMQALGSVMELAIRDNRLGMREYGGTQVKVPFMKQISSRRLKERCWGST